MFKSAMSNPNGSLSHEIMSLP